jgi:hypothetical protein
MEVTVAGFLKIATLSDEQVRRLRTLEASLGKHLMAFAPGLKTAALDDDQLGEVERLEAELGVLILAFEPPQA